MERKWSYYGGGQFNGGRMIVREVVSFMEGEWSFYRGGQFKRGRMVMLHFNGRDNGPLRSGVLWREHGHVIEEVSIIEV